MASAPTGSGKTAAFVIPVLSHLEAPKKGGIRGLLLAPTKELAGNKIKFCLQCQLSCICDIISLLTFLYFICFIEQIHREAVRLCAGRRIKINLLKKVTAAAALARKVHLLTATSRLQLLILSPIAYYSCLISSLLYSSISQQSSSHISPSFLSAFPLKSSFIFLLKLIHNHLI